MNTSSITNIKNSFITEFQSDPLMIFSPGRINIIGEHTDYNDGFVFSAKVNKDIIAAIGRIDSNTSTAYAADDKKGISITKESFKNQALFNIGSFGGMTYCGLFV